MADFVAVLRKTVGALSENTPGMREKVYEKARSTIEAKLAALNPQPPAAVADRQRKALEDAIAVLRADYAEAAEPEDDFDDIIASLDSPPPVPPSVPAPVAVTVAPEPSAAEARAEVSPANEPASDPSSGPASEDDAFHAEPAPPPEFIATPRAAPRRSSGRAGKGATLAVLVAILVVAGGTYALWLNRDAFFDSGGPVTDTMQEDVVTTAEELVEEEEAAPEDEEEVAVLPPAEETPAPEEPAAPPVAQPDAAVEKFTQRLLSDGTEVDEGPAGGERTIGEGTSVANIAAGEGLAGEEEAAAQSPTPATDAAQPAIAVGQRAIFYEERTSSAQGSAEMGSIVWTVVQESPGGDLPPEPAIRAEATIPAKDVQLRMTIRRNGDQTLPAAHIVEMIFLTPEGFEGGAVANISRLAMKETEQAAGNALIGIPAKIADGFFLIALSDTPNEIDANMTLLGSRSWIDIPIVYQSGRRALLSLEKGIPGERAFQETLQAWQEAASAG